MRDEEAGFDPRPFLEMMGTVGHHGTLGIQYIAHGLDWVEMALPYDEKLTVDDDSGILASGPIVSLMDGCTSIAVWIKLQGFRPIATLDLRIDYLRPATPGMKVIGRGECYGLKRSISFVRGIAHDGDPSDPVANVAATFMFTDA